MNYNKRILSILIVFLMSSFSCLMAQQVETKDNASESSAQRKDSLNRELLQEYKSRLLEMDSLRRLDSIKQVKLEEQLASLKTTDNRKIEDIQRQLADIQRRETDRVAREKARVDSLRSVATAYPIIGVLNDTIFSLYARLGSFTPQKERVISRLE